MIILNILTILILLIIRFVISAVFTHKEQLLKDLTKKKIKENLYKKDLHKFETLHENVLAGLFTLLAFTISIGIYEILTVFHPKIFTAVIPTHYIKSVGFLTMGGILLMSVKQYVNLMCKLSKKYKFSLNKYKIVA